MHLADARNQREIACEAAVVGDEEEEKCEEGKKEEEACAGNGKRAEKGLA